MDSWMQRESHGVLRHLMMNLTLNSPTCPIQCTSSKYKVLRSTQAHTHSAVCLRHLVLTLFTNSFVAVWVHMHLFLVETTFFKTYSESIKTVWVFLLLLFLGISVDWGIQADDFFFFLNVCLTSRFHQAFRFCFVMVTRVDRGRSTGQSSLP